VWPAVFFHSVHNTISQWLFPKFFAVADGQVWLRGESGVLPAAGYAVVAAALWIAMRRRGQSWSTVARGALEAIRAGAPPRG
jgi:hypothetical protein